MALTNATYTSIAKNSNLSENWVLQLFNQDSYLSFDGVNDYVDCGLTTSASATSLTEQVTFAFWINFPTLGVSEKIFSNNSNESKYGGFWLNKTSENKISIQWGDSTGGGSADREAWISDSAVFTEANTWYFCVVTTDFLHTNDANTTVFVGPQGGSLTTITDFTNGGTSNDSTPDYLSSGSYLYIGRRGDTNDTDFGQFKIRNFGMWSEQFDSDDVSGLYNSGAYVSFLANVGTYDKESSLVSYWEFNNGDPVVRDLKGEFSGSVVGATYHDFLPISFNDTVIDDIFYPGVITSQNLTIREKIDLIESKSSSNNLGIKVANFKYKDDDFSAEILFGSNYYLNRGVRIFSQLNGSTDIGDCLQIFHGRLTDISHNVDTVNLSLSQLRPWDKIEFPIAKHNKYNIYEPVVYGSYYNGGSTGDALIDSVYPVPIAFKGEHEFSTIMPKAYGASDGAELYYYAGLDSFLKLYALSDNSISSATALHGGLNIINTQRKCYALGWVTTENTEYTTTNVTFMTDPNNAFSIKRNTTNDAYEASMDDFATATFTDANESIYITAHTLPRTFRKSFVQSIKIKAEQFSTEDKQYFEVSTFGNEWATGDKGVEDNFSYIGDHGAIRDILDASTNNTQLNFTHTPAYSEASDLDSTNFYIQCPDEMLIKLTSKDYQLFTFEAQAFRVYNIKLQHYISFYYAEADSPAKIESDEKIFSDLKYLYSAGDGLTNSWDSSAIAYGHEAHRDILIRFCGHGRTEPENWDELHVDRTKLTNSSTANDKWKIRYSQLEPVSVLQKIEQLQKEFGFIAKFSPAGLLKYIYLVQSSEMSADHTLTKEDVSVFSISTTSLSDIVTKIEVSSRKHPSPNENTYFQIETGVNAPSRTKYNFQEKENIVYEKLDLNIGQINNTPQSDINLDWYSYYNNIVGDIKKIISCTIINKAKGYAMETGDLVTLSNMGVDPGGHSWTQSNSQYYCIVELQRSIGNVKIVMREVG